MTLSGVKHATLKKPRNQFNASSDLNHSQSNCSVHKPKFSELHRSKLSNNNGSSESREYLISRKPKINILSATFRGIGCKGAPMPVSASKIIRSTADWETEKRRKYQVTKSHSRARTPDNVVDDIPVICCTPHGISFASDVVPRSSMNPRRTTHVQHSRVARRNRSINDFSASATERPSNSIFSRAHSSNARQCDDFHHHSCREISQVNPIFEKFVEHDQYMDWRLNVDSMAYEELLELSNKIGHAGRGLREEEISSCLRIFKLSDLGSVPLLMSIDKGWRCSICQEPCKADEDVGRRGCGHCHHVDCIKQWLTQKSECPVCKIDPIADR